MSMRIALERLLRGRYWDGACGCYIGVTCPLTRVPRHAPGIPIAWRELVGESGLTTDEANAALDENDAFIGIDEGRYWHMVDWSKKRVAEEEHHA